MNKKVLFIILVILLVLGTIIIYLTFYTKCEKMTLLKFENMEEFKYLLDNQKNIESVTAIKLSEGGRDIYNVDSNIAFDMISNIKIKGKSNISIMDNYLTYIFKFGDNTEISFSFEGRFFNYNNQNYEIEGYRTIRLEEN